MPTTVHVFRSSGVETTEASVAAEAVIDVSAAQQVAILRNDSDVSQYVRRGAYLEIRFNDGQIIILSNYFDDEDEPELLLQYPDCESGVVQVQFTHTNEGPLDAFTIGCAPEKVADVFSPLGIGSGFGGIALATGLIGGMALILSGADSDGGPREPPVTQPTITMDIPVAGDDVINDAEDNALVISGTTTDVEDGQPVTVTFSDGVNPDIVVTTTVTGGVWSIPATDVSGLDDGNITITADVTNDSGGQNSHSITATLDSDPANLPTLNITTPIAGDDIVNDAEDNVVVISGTTTNVEDGRIVTVTFSDGVNLEVVVTTTVTGGAWSVAATDISGFDDGNITVTADVTDTSGNPANDSTTIVLDSDPANLPMLNITMPIGVDNVVNDAENDGLVISGTATNVENGQTVTVTISDGTNPDVVVTTTVTGGAWSIPATDISGLDDGNITITAAAADTSGNPTTASQTVSHDTAASITVTTPIATDDIVNAAEDDSLVISGTTNNIEDGQTVTVTIDDGTNPPITATANVAGGAWSVTGIDISGLDDGNVTITTDVADASGNPASDSTTIVLDSDPANLPTLNITTPIAGDDTVNAAEDDSLVISGTTTNVEDGQTVTVTISDGTNPAVTTTATVSSGAWTATAADVSGLDEGSLTVSAETTDTSGNPANDIDTVTLDASASITVTTPIAGDGVVNAAEDDALTISGDSAGVEAGQTVTVTFSDGVNPDVTANATVQADGSWSIPATDISSLDDGNVTVTANVADQAGNPASDSGTVVHDTIATIAIDTPIATDGRVNDAEDQSFTISGTTDVEDGQTVTVTLDDGSNPAVVVTTTAAGGAWSVAGVDISGFDEGNVTVTADVTDLSGNSGTVSAVAVHDTRAAIAIDAPIAIDNIVNDAEDNSLVVSGTVTDVEAGQTVTVTFSDGVNPKVTTTATVGAGGTWTAAAADISSLTDGTVTISADVADAAGNPASASRSVTLDSDPATLPTIMITTPVAADDIVNDLEEDVLTISGVTTNVEDGQTVTVKLDDGTSPPIIVTTAVAAGAWAITATDVSGLDDGNITITASVSDTSGNPATDSTIIAHDSMAVIDIEIPLAADGYINDAENDIVAVIGRVTNVEDGQIVTITFSDGSNPDVVVTTPVSGGVISAEGIDISSLNRGNVNVTAEVTDLAGNTVSDPELFIHDTLAVIAIDSPIATDNFIDSSEAAALTVSGTVINVDNGRTVTITFDDGTNPVVTTTAVVSGAAWTVAAANAADITGLNDGSITITAEVSDLAGNTATASNTSAVLSTTQAPAITMGAGATGFETVHGDAGDDIFDASSRIQYGVALFGHDGDDTLTGTDFNDYLNAGDGADTITGGGGNDTLYLGNNTTDGDSDTVVWTLGETGADQVYGFETGAGGDVLDLSGLLTGESASAVVLDAYLNFSQSGSHTVVEIDVDGVGAFSNNQQITLHNVDLTAGETLTDQDIINSLLADGNLVVS